MLNIKQLMGEEINKYLQVLIERYDWLVSKNLAMWNLENLSIDGLISRYENPQFYGAFLEGVCVGGFILIQQDKRYWPSNIKDRAFYFHKFVVSPKYGGMGYSEEMLEWAKKYTKIMNKDFLRLDYQKNRNYLRTMYRKHGFEDIEVTINSDGCILVLGEYKTS
jgi:GNAT superfamily N-acetyltransferase